MSSLSEHERRQFDRLTQVFASDDPILAKKLQRKSETTMLHFSPEDMWLVAFGIVTIAVFGIVTGFVTGNFFQTTGNLALGYLGYRLLMYYPVRKIGIAGI